ncbi:MAG: HutD family protein [Polaromonas sp.]|nr:HutD family protein [Polaromonas sp.]
MTWNVIHLADVDVTPWKNGGGVTRELVVWPSAEGWIWRMSVADVDQSGPFSKFEGIDRWFAVLDGAGVQLDVAGKSHSLSPLDAPFFFDGAAPVDCQLLTGKTVDFNLMVRRSCASAHMQRVSDGFETKIDATKVIAIYVMKSGAGVQFDGENLDLPASSLAWRKVSLQTRISLTGGDALWMEINS